ncbi:hypothetical protein AFK68_06570 [Hydrocoleum sp. CS-953]|uniref:hypothetical protein n=1 Tax=Hydrocoleum sp. CS-953 TaxID=1671698 RepID=UPI000B9B6762|nr:hypothetical protein [Hydrocoleum sp. CS-953]OZH55127.1 hypothetical protein AFK68_06570 [Hydrocoleum sp. CS-953]
MLRRNFLWYLLLFASSCTAATNNQPSNNNSLVKEKDKLLFAVSDVLSLEELKSDYEPFRIALEEVLDTKTDCYKLSSLCQVLLLNSKMLP